MSILDKALSQLDDLTAENDADATTRAEENDEDSTKLAAENGSEWRLNEHIRNVLDDAIERKRIIELVYYADSSMDLTIRRIYPLSTHLTKKHNVICEAWCCYRQAKRVFRVDRMRTVIVTDQSYQGLLE